MAADPRQIRYIGVSRYLEEHPDQRGTLEEMRYRLGVEQKLRLGRCEFCDRQPIAWAHDHDGIVAPRNHHIYWLMCDICQRLYTDGDDERLVERMTNIRPSLNPKQAGARLATFRRADRDHWSIS
jgi:hypothetical protein